MSDQTRNNILDGLLVSDAHVPGAQNLLYFSQRAERREYVEHVARLLGVPVDRVRDRARKPDARTGRVYTCSELRTLSDPAYALLRQRWYRDGRKVVPRDLRVSAEFVLHWFLCDGSCSVSRSSAQLVLCTDGFARNDVEFLREVLLSVGVENTPLGNNRIRVRQRSVNRFFEYIGESPVRCLAYKWIAPEYRVFRQKDLTPFYGQIRNLYVINGWSCDRIAKKFGTNYFSVRYILKNHFGIRFGKKATAETTCREGVVAPSETARRAPAAPAAG